MVQEILRLASSTEYDFRSRACPTDPFKHLFEEWVSYYRLKWAIARVLRPRRILEIGVRFGYSAAAFLDACPDASYLGIDNDSDTFSGQKGAINWARKITDGFRADYLIADSQQLAEFPGGRYDLVQIDGQQDGAKSVRDLKKAIKQARHILVDGYFSSRENFLHISDFVYRYRDLIESVSIIPGYAGELLIKPLNDVEIPNSVQSSEEIKQAYTQFYYLHDCGGFDSYKRDKGLGLGDGRLRAVAELADTAPIGRALDLGCGRGELSVYLAGIGHEVLAVDYSPDAIVLAKAAAAKNFDGGSQLRFFCGDVNDAPVSGLYDVVAASDLIEHLPERELDRLYANISSHLSPAGRFVVHTFPNAWYYKYEHARRMREARRVGAYIPIEPRSRYEELMHINEQSPRILKCQLSRHFKHVLLWFANHDLVNPFENLQRPFSKTELRASGDLFALASHVPIDATALLNGITMQPLLGPLDLGLRVIETPSAVGVEARFHASVRLSNNGSIEIKSGLPNPVHLSYHCYSEDGEVIVFDGLRTRILPLKPGATKDVSMNLRAPAHPGRFRFRLTLVQEWVRWFEDLNLFEERWIEVK